uniref:Uncharacterized protein n=1 Tax=Trypanosoma congolense (strain IL3000) TaxID=1068625 RepID=G0URT6_TRYCI|nr:hypothetical protein, unlikely [Trypanosoma congolense IL3000]
MQDMHPTHMNLEHSSFQPLLRKERWGARKFIRGEWVKEIDGGHGTKEEKKERSRSKVMRDFKTTEPISHPLHTSVVPHAFKNNPFTAARAVLAHPATTPHTFVP